MATSFTDITPASNVPPTVTSKPWATRYYGTWIIETYSDYSIMRRRPATEIGTTSNIPVQDHAAGPIMEAERVESQASAYQVLAKDEPGQYISKLTGSSDISKLRTPVTGDALAQIKTQIRDLVKSLPGPDISSSSSLTAKALKPSTPRIIRLVDCKDLRLPIPKGKHSSQTRVHSWYRQVEGKIPERKKLSDLPPPRRVAPPPPKASSFLNLPAEIRELIYDYVFDSALVLVSGMDFFGENLLPKYVDCSSSDHATGIPSRVFPCLARTVHVVDKEGQKRKKLHLELPKTWLDRKFHFRDVAFEQSCHTSRRKGVYQGSPYLNSGLLFTCRTIAREVAPLFYSRTALGFGSSKAVTRFINMQDIMATQTWEKHNSVISPDDVFFLHNSKNITNICLEIQHYGEPHKMVDRKYKSEFYVSWAASCLQMVEELPNLSNVAITAVVPRHPRSEPLNGDFSLTADWVSPMLQFGQSMSLKSAAVTLLLPMHRWYWDIQKRIGDAFSEVLRRKMLGCSDMRALEAIAEFRAQYSFNEGGAIDAGWRLLAEANHL